MSTRSPGWRTAVLGLGAGWLVACLTPIFHAQQPVTRVEAPPELRPGDRWVYEWKSGNDSGTTALEVMEIKEVNRMQYYLTRIGDADHFYTLDLRWAASARNSRVESRMVPPQPWFVWPLEVGRRWEHRGMFEDPERKSQHNDSFAVTAAELVEVPAGQFHALKLVRETDRRDSDVYWFSPHVHWYVKWIGRRGDIQFEEQLREFQLAPRLIPASPGN